MNDLTPAAPKRRWGLIALVSILILAAAGFAVVRLWARRPDYDRLRGGMLRYRVLFPEDFQGDRGEVIDRTVDVIARRLNECGVEKFGVSPWGRDCVSVEFSGVDRAAFERCKALLSWTISSS